MSVLHPQITADQPATRTFGVGEADRRRGRIEHIPLPTLFDERGELPVGALCVSLDHALGCRIADHLGAGDRIVTSHMHLEVLAPGPLGDELLVATNTGTTMVPGSAFCAAEVTRPDGGVAVRASGRFAIVHGEAAAGGRVVPVETTAVAADLSDDLSGVVGDSPILALFGARIVGGVGDVIRSLAIARTEFANERGGVHGGVGAFMCERVAALALRHRAGDDHPFRTVEMRVFFARPLAASGGAVGLATEIGFLGRTTASTTTRLFRPDGKLAVQVDVTHLARPTGDGPSAGAPR